LDGGELELLRDGLDALKRLVTIKEALHVARLDDLEAPHFDFLHHA
jgi:hypothetical protein